MYGNDQKNIYSSATYIHTDFNEKNVYINQLIRYNLEMLFEGIQIFNLYLSHKINTLVKPFY